jgi:hypothetical protein
MARIRENNCLAIQDGEPLNILLQLHFQLFHLSPYDAIRREAWFDEAQNLLALANNASQQAEWVSLLAWAYKKHLGPGIPICMIMGRLLLESDDKTVARR